MSLVIELGELFIGVVGRIVRGRLRWPELLQALAHIGADSLPIIAISTTFAGIVIITEITYHMDLLLHTVSMVPGFTSQFILREIGVVIPAMLLISRSGAAMTAEIGSMKVTEQIDALRLLGIDPIEYLVVPRFLAFILSLGALTVFAVAITLICSALVAVQSYHFGWGEYLIAVNAFVRWPDLVTSLLKGCIFGAAIPIVCAGFGFKTREGAEGVGMATTQAVVASTVSVILLDFILTYVFSHTLLTN